MPHSVHVLLLCCCLLLTNILKLSRGVSLRGDSLRDDRLREDTEDDSQHMAAWVTNDGTWVPDSPETLYGWSEVLPSELFSNGSGPSRYKAVRQEVDKFLHSDFALEYGGNSSFPAADARHYSGGLPVYVSITTISSRVDKVALTIMGILQGTVRPNRLYLMISQEEYLLDKGINRIALPQNLVDLKLAYPDLLRIVFVHNYGPHRKLLPILAKFWQEDVLLVTMDDDNEQSTRRSVTLGSLLLYYRASNRASAVALRVRKIGICDSVGFPLMSYRRYWGGATPHRNEFLLLPMGTGGILYRPRFFHPVVFSVRLRHLTRVGDDLAFRLSCMAQGTRVVTACDMSYNSKCPKREQDIKLYSNGEMEGALMMRRARDELKKEAVLFMKTNVGVDERRQKTRSGIEQEQEQQGGNYNPHYPHPGGNNNPQHEQERAERSERETQNEGRIQKLLDKLLRSEGGRLARQVGSASNASLVEPGESTAITTAAATAIGRRRLIKDNNPEESLYIKYNRFSSNDASWDKAVHFLTEKGIFDFDAQKAAWVQAERPLCMSSYWKADNSTWNSGAAEATARAMAPVLKYAERVGYSGPALVAKMPRRPRGCMMYTCKNGKWRGRNVNLSVKGNGRSRVGGS